MLDEFGDYYEVSFVATGIVIQMQASTLPGVDIAHTLIFQVESVIKSPSVYSDLAGEKITIHFEFLPDISKGTELTIEANGWIFGETLGLQAEYYTIGSCFRPAA